MYEQYMSFINGGQMSPGFMFLYAVSIIWTIIWKGIALWRSAKNDDKYWFVALLVINTLGILEICYIYFFSKEKRGKKESK